MLTGVRPRDIAGKTRRRIAAEELADLIATEAKIKKATAELKSMVLARDSRLMDLHGIGPVVAARILADVGDVTRFADRNRFASWTGTAPLDASSGEQNRHRLSRAGNRRMNHMIHIAAVTQIRLDTEGRAYYRRKRAAGKKPMEAMRCLKRRISDALFDGWLPMPSEPLARVREGTAGDSRIQRGRPTPAHRHFGSATSRTRTTDVTTDHAARKDTAAEDPSADRLTTEGSRNDAASSRRVSALSRA
jgi:Transposase IS116/IS110/IS902 family